MVSLNSLIQSWTLSHFTNVYPVNFMGDIKKLKCKIERLEEIKYCCVKEQSVGIRCYENRSTKKIIK